MPSYAVICDNQHQDNVFCHRIVEGNDGLPACRTCQSPTRKHWGGRGGVRAGEGDWGEELGGIDPETGAPVTVRNEAERRALEAKWRKTSGCADGVLMTETAAQARVKREEAYHRRIVEGRKMGLPDPVMTRSEFWR